ncbi:MAG: hypothetical protein RLZZ293_452 [Pseudomonadota bacterium]
MNKSQYLTGIIFSLGIIASPLSFANQATKSCSFVSGKLIKFENKPVFQFNRARSNNQTNYPMSHSQFFIQDSNGKIYKIVLDNLFYSNLTSAQATSNTNKGIIEDLTRRYPVGSNVDACGKLYQRHGKVGLHFVHPSACSTTKFNGFLRINSQDIANNHRYCDGCACKLSNKLNNSDIEKDLD